RAWGGRLHPNDSQRLIRAWEVLEATGRPLPDWQGQAEAKAAPPYDFRRVVVLPPRDGLYASCDARFDAMLKAGALEEVRALMERGLDPALPAMKALAVPELIRHLRGELNLAAAGEAARTATRRYAKRQITWLRGEEARQKIQTMTVNEKFSESNAEKIFPKIREFVLTPSR
ncbi:MAG: tRNA dimethylallyltransferase, partial [Rhodovibrionaceae bacterium]